MTKEEALKQLGELKFALSGTDEQFLDIVALEMAIKALEQKPKTGRWKANFRFGMSPNEEHFICSECNGQSMRQSKYCPECGSRMEGGD